MKKGESMSETQKILTYESSKEKELRNKFLDLYRKCPIPEEQLLSNLGLFLNSKNLSRILFMDFIYMLLKLKFDFQGHFLGLTLLARLLYPSSDISSHLH